MYWDLGHAEVPKTLSNFQTKDEENWLGNDVPDVYPTRIHNEFWEEVHCSIYCSIRIEQKKIEERSTRYCMKYEVWSIIIIVKLNLKNKKQN